jgi:hypothetical protein
MRDRTMLTTDVDAVLEAAEEQAALIRERVGLDRFITGPARHRQTPAHSVVALTRSRSVANWWETFVTDGD